MQAPERGDVLDPVRRCFEAWDRGDVEAVLAEYADEVEVDASRIAEGVYRGKDAVRAFYAEIFDSTRFTNEDVEYEVVGDRVLVLTRISGSGTRSGATFDARFGYLFTVERGAVSGVVFYPDAQSGRAALLGEAL